MSKNTTLYWIRRDFRLQDNAALSAAIRTGNPVLPVFISEEMDSDPWGHGSASRWWLHRAIEDAKSHWQARGGDLFICRSKDPLATLLTLSEQVHANKVVWNRCYEPHQQYLDTQIKRGLHDAGVEAQSFADNLLIEPQTIGTADGKPYKVYTPFWKACQVRGEPDAPIKVPLEELKVLSPTPESLSLEALNLLPKHPWYKKLDHTWRVGEKEALQQMSIFIREHAAAYNIKRDFPATNGTSRLSPYLHWGHINVRTVVHTLKAAHTTLAGGPLVYLKELFWREFAYNVLYHFPHTPDKPLRPEFMHFPWQQDTVLLKRWQNGETGYPLVDAGMRELYATGWMHNRVRMVVASFLVKHLLQPWQDGARWFWDTLVDADLASNTLGWQWSSGCGADAAPYFRIFNPIIQSYKFDPEGQYLKKWLPELQSLSAEYIHKPWEAPAALLQNAGIKIDKHYPAPVINHEEGRNRALKALADFKII
jgi:deoxyribodipyrimidine photo-lyase